MNLLENKNIGLAVCGSFCTISKIFEPVQKLMEEGAQIYPIMSEHASSFDTRFGTAEYFMEKLKDVTGKEVINNIVDAEPIGPGQFLDCLVVAPCTGNTMAKIANGITDTSVLMAVKAMLRNSKPVILAISTNDGLGFNLKNMGFLINAKNIYFIPFGQDDWKNKPNSLTADLSKMKSTIIEALQGKQLQPIIIGYSTNKDFGI